MTPDTNATTAQAAARELGMHHTPFGLDLVTAIIAKHYEPVIKQAVEQAREDEVMNWTTVKQLREQLEKATKERDNCRAIIVSDCEDFENSLKSLAGILTEYELYGDSYMVPNYPVIVDTLKEKLTAEITHSNKLAEALRAQRDGGLIGHLTAKGRLREEALSAHEQRRKEKE